LVIKLFGKSEICFTRKRVLILDRIFDLFFGEIDENKEYYTDDMLNQEFGHFILCILLDKNIITQEELIEYKEVWKKHRNKQLIDEMKRFKGEQ